MKNATKWAMFALLPFGCYGDILGQNHDIIFKKKSLKIGKNV
jgi:hypothetical protein